MAIFKTMAMILCCVSYILLSTTGEATEYQAAIIAGSYCRMRYTTSINIRSIPHIIIQHFEHRVKPVELPNIRTS